MIRQPFIAIFLVVSATGLLVVPTAMANDEGTFHDRGRRIWEDQCVQCHGAGGEGVDGEYDEPLYGDWSIEKLTRIIHKTMPEEDPGLCEDEEAAAVARYIHETFYSAEARARIRPARIELVRLTNPQYLNVVADLLKPFAGDNPVGLRRGLQGSYYSGRNFNRDGKVFDRIDGQVRFDFAEGSPDFERFPDEEFAIRWRGSVIAAETGDYEFVVRSENGVRLWVNDDDGAVIDGWVSSGQVVEHRTTIRLIGGRAYPLRLDFFKFKDKSASVALMWRTPHGVEEVIPRRALAPDRVDETLVVTTRFPPDDQSVGYERGVAVSKAWDDATTHAAIEAANYVVDHLNRLARTSDEATDRVSEIREYCVGLVEAAFRRPLSEDERVLFVDEFFQDGVPVDNAVKRVVLLALKSPRFLYLGLNDGPLDDFTVAERLSFGLWDSLPDPALLNLARRGQLKSELQVRTQAKRMLGNPRTRAKLNDFLHHWLELDHVDSLVKDTEQFPEFTPEVVADLRTSLELFLEDVLWSDTSDYRALLLADYLYLNDRLSAFYGVEADVGDFTRVRSEGGRRAGVITHPYLLASFSYPNATSPIHRGVFLTRNIVGRALKPPPMAVEFKDNDFPDDLTMREKVAELTKDEACQSCHSVINPLGFSLEQFDAVGRWRVTEKDKPVDPVSEYLTDQGESVRLTGARDLAVYAAESETAQRAFVEQLWHQIVKQPLAAYGDGLHDRLHSIFKDSDFNVKTLLVEIACAAALQGNDSTQLVQTHAPSP